jgi:hypothetical protein
MQQMEVVRCVGDELHVWNGDRTCSAVRADDQHLWAREPQEIISI